MSDPDAVATAVMVQDEKVVCRLYAAGEHGASGAAHAEGLQPGGLRSLAGEQVAGLAPFQIGELVLLPERG